jgi:hypothetical protein
MARSAPAVARLKSSLRVVSFEPLMFHQEARMFFFEKKNQKTFVPRSVTFRNAASKE